jgi:hypothetical protein
MRTVMDLWTEDIPATGLDPRLLRARLDRLGDRCAWTGGQWEFPDGSRAAWNGLENTTAGIRRLSALLLRAAAEVD